jgi:uncharacterized repeat protein (TIGR01451 family)
LQLNGKQVMQSRPVIYQEIAGTKQIIAGRYIRMGRDQIGLALGVYDRRFPLIIDPVLVYSTYLGGVGDDQGLAIDVDGMGQAYITGSTLSPDFPLEDASQSSLASETARDVFVSKFNADGTNLLYSTYFGGERGDEGSDIAVTSDGHAYVVGVTLSSDFPHLDALQDSLHGISDAFVASFDPAGVPLFSTFVGGNSSEFAYGVALDGLSDVYVVGSTRSTDFLPFQANRPFQATKAGGRDAFVTKISADGSQWVYSTYLGGEGDDCFTGSGSLNGVPNIGCRVAVDQNGSAMIAGVTESAHFPAGSTDPLQAEYGGGHDGFVAKLSPAGDSLMYSTYLGGSDFDQISDIDVDSDGSAYVIGWTFSEDFPISGSSVVFQGQYGEETDVFVTKLSPDGDEMIYFAVLGGSENDNGYAIAVGPNNQTYITGATKSMDFPIKNSLQAYQAADDVFVTVLNAIGNSTIYSSYLGGARHDRARSIAIDATGAAYITGDTLSPDYGVENPFQSALASPDVADVFVTKLAPTTQPSYHFEYAAKIACGSQVDPADMRLARGFYATTINVHNPNNGENTFFKKVALTFPPEAQRPGEIFPIAEDMLQYDEALAVDCLDIREEVFSGTFPTPYIEGFVVMQSVESLDVVAVYSTAALDATGQATSHSSIDVEQVLERGIPQPGDLEIIKTAKPEAAATAPTIISYVIEVTNHGPVPATNVIVQDVVEVEVGALTSIVEADFSVSHGGQWMPGPVTATSAELEATIPSLPAGETAILTFAVMVIGAPPSFLERRVVDTAHVSSDMADANPDNDSITIVTTLP